MKILKMYKLYLTLRRNNIELKNKIKELDDSILKSDGDRKIFFDAVMRDSEPNHELKKAFREYIKKSDSDKARDTRDVKKYS